MNKRINIVVGHYGSGKTEFSINYALYLKKKFGKVYIADLDIVNPYFRTADAGERLRASGINLIASPYAGTNVDIPSLPADIMRAFDDKNACVVLDIGGDDDGAIVLGRFRELLNRELFNMFFVINTLRPQTETADGIISMLKNIEASSRQKVTALINNSNLAELTKPEHIITAQKTIEEVSRLTEIPIEYICGTKDVLDMLPGKYADKFFYITRYLKLIFNN